MPTAKEEDADIIVVNTCTVREHASQKALSVTGGYKHLKKKNPELIICICGCLVSTGNAQETIKKSYPYIDIVFGTESLWRLPELIYKKLSERKRVFLPNIGKTDVAEGLPVRRGSTFKAWTSIMYGCDNFCTYCIVPYARGRERSRRPEDILKEIKELTENGYKEITLLGQNVNSYGRGLDGECDFSDLLAKAADFGGEYLVRFMTSHPKDASVKLFDTMASHKNIAHQLHLPIQSGSDRILKLMNRRYTRDYYIDLVQKLRERVHDVTLSTDIMLGLPGETDEDFEYTLDILRRVEFDMIYSFIYSIRPGTPAAEMDNQVGEETKGERMKRLLETQEEIALRKNTALVGKTLRVLCEGRSKNNPDIFTGRTNGNKIVLFDGDDGMTGKFVDIKIEKARTFDLSGKTVG